MFLFLSQLQILFNNPQVTYILGRETLILDGKKGMSVWRESIFSYLSRNSQLATKFFNLPSEQVLEIGSHIEL